MGHSSHEMVHFEKCKKHDLTKVELAVDLFTVHNVEPVLDFGIHVADFKVEPLVMVVGVDVWVENEVILIGTDLENNNTIIYRAGMESRQQLRQDCPPMSHCFQIPVLPS